MAVESFSIYTVIHVFAIFVQTLSNAKLFYIKKLEDCVANFSWTVSLSTV